MRVVSLGGQGFDRGKPWLSQNSQMVGFVCQVQERVSVKLLAAVSIIVNETRISVLSKSKICAVGAVELVTLRADEVVDQL